MNAPNTSTAGEARRIAETIQHAAHLLPAQAPLARFVHHNTLHAFESLPFVDAVEEAADLLGNRAWLEEERYLEAWSRGRILPEDLELALQTVPNSPIAPGVDRRDLVRGLMRCPPLPLGGERLAWHLTETDALRELPPSLPRRARGRILAEGGGDERLALERLWDACRSLPSLPATTPSHPDGVRVAAVLRHKGGVDPDRITEPHLMRWMAAFLDPQVAYWPATDREQGFLRMWATHQSVPLDLAKPWRAGVMAWIRRAAELDYDVEALILELLAALGHPQQDHEAVVLETLLTLRGWAGMFQRLTERPDLAPHITWPTDVSDVLAVRLILDHAVGAWVIGREQGPLLPRAQAKKDAAPDAETADPTWLLFCSCLAAGVGPQTLTRGGPELARALLDETLAHGPRVRQRLWHIAYERRHVETWLDAASVHACRVRHVATPPPRVQAVFCIDDREESIRRHLEEVAPWFETLGAAGNYGISMYYQGLEHGEPVALGPAGFAPRHLVREVTIDEGKRSTMDGLVQRNVEVGSQTLLRGSLVAMGGWAAAFPMAARVLAPRATANALRRRRPKNTDLVYERAEGTPPAADGLFHGFTLTEQVQIVESVLRAMGLTRNFAPLVCLFGHGSHSQNNPHAAAYDCGACGGGRGFPNARLFARWGNDPRVRTELDLRGITIPETTWFLGAYHDTADDDVRWYDLDRVPDALSGLLGETRLAMDEARTRDAHERCRKFESAPLDITPARALAHVEARSEDLSQPRPELGHATNGLCFVGRRAWSRGLFLDRRAFLVSYDPETDESGQVLVDLLGQLVPVGAGISLEYWFSHVDPQRYGCGSKLPHNVTGLIGVMDGHQSDLRTGLPWQMVELHEPVRLLCVVEATPAQLLRVATERPAVGQLVSGGWVTLASLDPDNGNLQVFENGAFVPWTTGRGVLGEADSSRDWYQGTRGTLPPASILPEGGQA